MLSEVRASRRGRRLLAEWVSILIRVVVARLILQTVAIPILGTIGVGGFRTAIRYESQTPPSGLLPGGIIATGLRIKRIAEIGHSPVVAVDEFSADALFQRVVHDVQIAGV